ncbi:hypothetical protein SSX86_024764 [Deinandra increscens subsp. villosa]|uniref:Replication protein A 70 kDa DNA-binding subunit B/D first OB fold domain-containing protein n=1 Tax=Deinandra increscens subsp. villosa TaxID=3103831 RepID=A0AAP0CGL2_9ASTR
MAEIEVYDSITDLEISNNNHKLKVKILKTWRRHVFNNPKHTYSLEFVCADEQGNRAQGSCLATFFYRFERFLEEQNVLTIKKPLLGSNRGSWTVINSPLKICFNRESQLALSPEWSGSRHSFSFTDFKTIIDCQASRTSSIDIIGMLIDCSPIKKKMKNDVETSWVLIQLQDLSGEKIWVTLFDEYAYKITEFLLANPDLGDRVKCAGPSVGVEEDSRYRIAGSSFLAAMDESSTQVSSGVLDKEQTDRLKMNINRENVKENLNSSDRKTDRSGRGQPTVDSAEVLRRWTHGLQHILKQSLHLANANDGEGPDILRSANDGGTSGHAEPLAVTLADQ